MNTNLIQWPRAKYWDRAWNPWLGCKPVSPACENCYARCATVERFGQSFEPHKTHKVNPPNSGVIFCGNMTDLFGEWVGYPEHYVAKAVDAGQTADAMLFLTKRAERMAKFLDEFGPCRDWQKNGWLDNVFFGFTAENQEWFNRRFDEIVIDWPDWANLWLSLEPLLGPIDLRRLPLEDVQWIVVGCESGPNRRPCKIEWVESIVEECQHYGVPVFVKQLDLGGKCVTDIEEFPEHLRIRQVPWKRADGKEIK